MSRDKKPIDNDIDIGIDINMNIDIDREYKKYLNNKTIYVISDKQIKYIKSLYYDHGDDKSDNKSNDDGDDEILDFIEDILEKPIKCWSDIKHRDAKFLIAYLKNRKSLTLKQKQYIEGLYDLDYINKFFKSSFDSYDELKYYHVKRLLNDPNKFSIVSLEKPIVSTDDFEYGYQDSPLCENDKMYYIKYYDLMMLDYDDMGYNDIVEKLSSYRETHYFHIYETYNGYHVFIMSQKYNHNNMTSYNIMMSLDCDKNYCNFSYKNGYKIRLNKKIGRNEKFVSRYISDYGNSDLCKTELVKLLSWHDHYLDFHKNN